MEGVGVGVGVDSSAPALSMKRWAVMGDGRGSMSICGSTCLSFVTRHPRSSPIGQPYAPSCVGRFKSHFRLQPTSLSFSCPGQGLNLALGPLSHPLLHPLLHPSYISSLPLSSFT